MLELQQQHLIFGGDETTGYTETWNGTNWTEVNDLNTARAYLGGAGETNTEALAFGGESTSTNTANTESWNGTNWTEVNNLNTARNGGAYGSTGSYTACLYIGGNSGSVQAIVEQWNGTNWTEVADLSAAKEELMGSGTTSSAIAAFGRNPSTAYKTSAEQWIGPGAPIGVWATGNVMNLGRRVLAGAGIQTAALAFGGDDDSGPTIVGNTESYNGTNWTEVNDLTTARSKLAGAGTQTAALAFGENHLNQKQKLGMELTGLKLTI